MTSTTAKVIATFLIMSVSMQMCCGSAIPIWEFLTRNEKMSYLYSTFAQLVSVHCKATAATSAIPVNQCKRNLLGYGYERLQTFDEAQLDILDPYQRGANELIWSSIMRNHPSSTLVTTRLPLSPTPPASSIIIMTQQRPPSSISGTHGIAAAAATNAGSTLTNAQQQQQFILNPLFNANGQQQHNKQQQQQQQHTYAMDMDIAYGGTGGANKQQTFLSGPLVFRLRPDGTPIEEDQYNPLPRDDDLEAFPTILKSNPNSGVASSGSTATTTSGTATSNGRPNKHRKIATISALKEQRLGTFALQQELQPPKQETRIRRQFQTHNGYFYGRQRA